MTQLTQTHLTEGLVVRIDAKQCHIRLGQRVVAAAPRGALFEDLGHVKNPVAVGDRVLVDLATEPASLVEVLPRKNQLSRQASSHDPREQVLFANVDQLLVIASVEKPRFSSNRTDRILAACAYHDIPTHLVLNKIDLGRAGVAAEICATYERIGVPVLMASATSGQGVEEFASLLRGKTSALYGGSGVGKSTLLNILEPGLKLKVGKISAYWDQGKHTTSYSQVHELPSLQARVIDTPGIRVFRLYGVNEQELRDCFPEFLQYGAQCRFSGCSHTHEPGCAVHSAFEREEIAPTRFESYVEMLAEAVPVNEPADESEGEDAETDA
jgi:ribosome biogenesis GTPase / thiamine phosphate phosphatase